LSHGSYNADFRGRGFLLGLQRAHPAVIKPFTHRSALSRNLLLVGLLLATLGAVLVWSFAQGRTRSAHLGPALGAGLDPAAAQVASQERSAALIAPELGPADRGLVKPIDVTPPPVDPFAVDMLAAKYEPLSLLELEMAAAEIEASNSIKFKMLLEDRYSKGHFTVLQGKRDEETGGFWFHGGGSRYQATFQVPGSQDTRHYVELPESEYPEMYALKAEQEYLGQRIAAIKKGYMPK
jgi:hypothetical protein